MSHLHPGGTSLTHSKEDGNGIHDTSCEPARGKSFVSTERRWTQNSEAVTSPPSLGPPPPTPAQEGRIWDRVTSLDLSFLRNTKYVQTVKS